MQCGNDVVGRGRILSIHSGRNLHKSVLPFCCNILRETRARSKISSQPCHYFWAPRPSFVCNAFAKQWTSRGRFSLTLISSQCEHSDSVLLARRVNLLLRTAMRTASAENFCRGFTLWSTPVAQFDGCGPAPSAVSCRRLLFESISWLRSALPPHGTQIDHCFGFRMFFAHRSMASQSK